MRTELLITFGLLIAAGGAAFWLWSDPFPGRVASKNDLDSIRWNTEVIVNASGDTLTAIDAFPDRIPVSENVRFGSSVEFTGAALSPDRTWIAITIRGAAHTFGWLYHPTTGEKHPVAFQYGGGIDIGSWSPDANFVVFIERSPGEISSLKLVDRRSIGEYVDDTGLTIQIPQEEKLSPPFAYTVEEWQAPHTLCFRLDGIEQCINAETGRIVEQ